MSPISNWWYAYIQYRAIMELPAVLSKCGKCPPSLMAETCIYNKVWLRNCHHSPKCGKCPLSLMGETCIYSIVWLKNCHQCCPNEVNVPQCCPNVVNVPISNGWYICIQYCVIKELSSLAQMWYMSPMSILQNNCIYTEKSHNVR